MSKSAPLFPGLLRTLSVAFAIGMAATSWAISAQGGFIATLSMEQVKAAGISTLTDAQRSALDQLVQLEVAQARQAGSTELDGTFSSRRTGLELQRAGLDQLTPEQLKKLDGLIASAVASSPKPRERPRLKDSDVFNPQTKPQVHGEFSLTYGHVSGAGDFKGASMWMDVFDPKTGISLGVGISQFSGPGYWGYGYFPGYYDFGPGFGYDDGFGYSNSPFRRASTGGMIGLGSPLLDVSYGWQRSPGYYRDFRHN